MFNRITGIFLIGMVIKLMDDFLDRELDQLKKQVNLASLIGPGILPYCLVLLIIALYYNFTESMTLFFASYIIGMANDGYTKLPTRLKGWQEGILIFLISISLTSLSETLSALNLIILVQLIDDFVDYKRDSTLNLYIEGDNLIQKLGYIPALILTIILILISIKLFPLKLILFSMGTILVNIVYSGLIKLYNGDNL